MKKLILTTIFLFGLTSCNKSVKTAENNIKEKREAPGSYKDNHGCITSAGQTWSQLQQDCIQVFNKGFRLNPIEYKKDEAVISAFILFNDDQSKLELFLPEDDDQNKTFILNKVNNEIYQDEHYKYDSNKSVLYVNGIEKYKGNVE